MKTTTFFRTLLLVLLMAAAGGTFFSCEKPEEPTQEQPQTPSATITTSDVDIQGTWECVRPQMSGDNYIRITFAQQLYSVDGYHPFPTTCMFNPQEVGNYLIRDSLFYMWHTTVWPNSAEMPFQENIAPMFRVSFKGDTLCLRYMYGLTQDYMAQLTFWEFVRI